MKKKVTDKDVIVFIRSQLDLQGEAPPNFECITPDDCAAALNNTFGWVHLLISMYGLGLVDISMHVNRIKADINLTVSGKTIREAMINLIREVLINKSDFMEG
jgi:hypothetical protein